jgi:hypothetical protein
MALLRENRLLAAEQAVALATSDDVDEARKLVRRRAEEVRGLRNEAGEALVLGRDSEAAARD